MKTLKNTIIEALCLTIMVSGISFSAYAQSNVALNKTTSQSSNYAGTAGQSWKAVDGNTDGQWNGGSVTHTIGGKGENNPWWTVDLGNLFDISAIHIWNRTDCCSERIDNIVVYVKSDDPDADWSPFYPVAYRYNSDLRNPIKLSGSAQARYVKVQVLNPAGILSLAEVEVLGIQLLEIHKEPVQQTVYSPATSEGVTVGCLPPNFFDPIDGGTCWFCPDGFNRSVASVTSDKACEKPATEIFASAIEHGRGSGLFGTDCPGGQFWDPNGYCYSCPEGYSRTAYPVTSENACSQRQPPKYVSATKWCAATCGEGYFLDLTTRSCWTCPSGYTRTVFPVTGDQACEKVNK